MLSVTREQGVIVRDTESKEENHNFIPEDLSGYKYVEEGQLVINKMKSWQGAYGVSDYEGIVSPAYFVCDLDFSIKRFFSLALRSSIYISFFAQYSKEFVLVMGFIASRPQVHSIFGTTSCRARENCELS